MDEAAESMAIAQRFAHLAAKNLPEDYEVVIHAAYDALLHAARVALLAARGSASTAHGQVLKAFAALAEQADPAGGPKQSRTSSAAYDLRILSDHGWAGRDFSHDATI
jgi:uncharacterized protein (UPF0332 family)